MDRDRMCQREAREREFRGDRGLALVVRAQPEESWPSCPAQSVIRGALCDLRQPRGCVDRPGGAARPAVLVPDHCYQRRVGDEVSRHVCGHPLILSVVHRENLEVQSAGPSVSDGHLDRSEHGHADNRLRRGQGCGEADCKTHVRSSSTLTSMSCLACPQPTAGSCGGTWWTFAS